MKISSSLSALLTSAIAIGGPVLASVISGKATSIEDLAQKAVKSAVTTVDGGLDKLSTAFITFEAANPIVKTAIDELYTLSTAAGLKIPTPDVALTQVKAALFDLATMFVSSDDLKAAEAAATAAATTAGTATAAS
ncbi:hypothetical protein [Brytella acorum]|uniref:Uncharacterized protein n=1 Tax=Brytella acorum TaxID=2959299 RepID=A0AA35XW52_9PROT|nr:hypothetical protein [Brytella acorum]CAI9120463.1 hypothetical protein LMG32879_001296 [Brytella acorum]